MDNHVDRIEVGWDDTKEKATARLTLLNNTKAAWEGYGAGLENIAVEFEKAEEEIKKVKKRFNLQAAVEDLEKRQKIYGDTKKTIDNMYGSIQHDYDVMTMTLPEDKKDFVKKEVKAVTDKLEVMGRFQEKVEKIAQMRSKTMNAIKYYHDVVVEEENSGSWIDHIMYLWGKATQSSEDSAPQGPGIVI